MRNYFKLSILIATSFWFLESLIHSMAFNEPFTIIPIDSLNELWMRSLICILIIGFGRYVQVTHIKILNREKEKLELLKATVVSIQHHINNHLNIASLNIDLVGHNIGEEIEGIENTKEQVQYIADYLNELASLEKLEFTTSPCGKINIKTSKSKY